MILRLWPLYFDTRVRIIKKTRLSVKMMMMMKMNKKYIWRLLCATASTAMARLSCRNFVRLCLSVRPSVTRMDQSKTVQAIGSPSFYHRLPGRNSKGFTPSEGVKWARRKVIFSSTLTHSQCDAGNITFRDFCCFRCACSSMLPLASVQTDVLNMLYKRWCKTAKIKKYKHDHYTLA